MLPLRAAHVSLCPHAHHAPRDARRAARPCLSCLVTTNRAATPRHLDEAKPPLMATEPRHRPSPRPTHAASPAPLRERCCAHTHSQHPDALGRARRHARPPAQASPARITRSTRTRPRAPRGCTARRAARRLVSSPGRLAMPSA
ncbi:hypothetical protein PVAP13_2KG086316 [Panicum virgatum]|uniref:Uncharacterized protein n=1 Tax=Panicum virgatum TaxID=38727 RepID=A0A8T0VYW5_PANVG|nr:hypothetical protein PVAP13_2KG086316 [Panicum virgatum]